MNVVNGSLDFKDFHKGEVPSFEQFQKLQATTQRFKKVAKAQFAEEGELGTVKSEVGAIKGDVDSIKGALGTYVKSADADARYLKSSDSVVRGDGSVFSATRLITNLGRGPVMEVPGLVAVEAENGKPRLVYVINQTAGPLTHTRCGEGAFETSPGVFQPGKSFHCQITDVPMTIQLFGEGLNPLVVTMTLSAIGNLGENAQYTVQILVGA